MRLALAFVLTLIFLQTNTAFSAPTNQDWKSTACKVALVTIGVAAAPAFLFFTGHSEAASEVAWGLTFSGAFAVLRARNSDSIARPLTAFFGFPFSLIPWAFVKEGSHKVFGIKIPEE
ncbi:MAG: hypothetical protein JWQ35_1004 [Bacteriovoracaceae bacterium]|nr:hypothetical protein [Bacteriovoracaceae bacterium]